MHESYSLHKDGGSANEPWIFIKRGDPQQCLWTLTEQDCCSSYKYLEVVRWRQLQFTLKRKVDRTVYEVSSGNDAMCLLLECWKSQLFSREKATLKLLWMENVLFNGRWADLNGTLKWSRRRTILLLLRRKEASAAFVHQDKRHWTCGKLCVKTLFYSGNFHS